MPGAVCASDGTRATDSYSGKHLKPSTFQDYEARIGALEIDLVGETECRSGSNNANGLMALRGMPPLYCRGRSRYGSNVQGDP